MVIYKREMVNGKYKCKVTLGSLTLAANTEKIVPRDWINKEGNFVTQEFIDYVLPLIQGDAKAPLEDGMPRFVRLKKVQAGKNK